MITNCTQKLLFSHIQIIIYFQSNQFLKGSLLKQNTSSHDLGLIVLNINYSSVKVMVYFEIIIAGK